MGDEVFSLANQKVPSGDEVEVWNSKEVGGNLGMKERIKEKEKWKRKRIGKEKIFS